MSFPDVTRVVNDVQRSNIRYRDIVELAVIDYYKKLGQAEAIKEATSKKEPILQEAEAAVNGDQGRPVEEKDINDKNDKPEKPLSRMNKNELLAKCSEYGIADKVDINTTNSQLIKMINDKIEDINKK